MGGQYVTCTLRRTSIMRMHTTTLRYHGIDLNAVYIVSTIMHLAFDRQIDRRTDRQTHRQTDTHTHTHTHTQ